MSSRKYNYDTKYVSKRPTRFLDKKDKRYESYVKFKERHGFSPDECWNLDETLAEFLLPRLRFFRNHTCGYPAQIKTFEKWQEILDQIIWSFEEKVKCGGMPDFDVSGMSFEEADKKKQDYWKKYRKGLRLFEKWWLAFWW